MDSTEFLFFTNLAFSESCIHPRIKVISNRIMDEIVAPLIELGLDDTEFVYLKALIFFDFGITIKKFLFFLNILFIADVKGLSARNQVERIRKNILRNLEDYINNLQFDTSGRYLQV